MDKFIRLYFLCLLVLVQVKSFAQKDSVTTVLPVDDIFSMSLDKLMNLDISLETGSFLDLDFNNSPASLTIITEEQIHNSGARHISEVLEIYVPGFQYMYNKWNGIIWGMRGVAADRNTKFIFCINGHKMNLESRDGAMTELDLGLMDDIERIEVLRGPAGIVYGSGAIAGVVNVVTKKSSEDFSQVSTQVETWGMNTSGFKAETFINRKLDPFTTVGFSLGYKMSEGSGLERSRIYGKASWPYSTGSTNEIPQNGVPSMGSTWSTPGNVKGSFYLRHKNLNFYSRVTHQVTNVAGLFPIDAWPDVTDAYTNADSLDVRYVDGAYRSPKSVYGKMESYGENRRQYQFDAISLTSDYTHLMKYNELKFELGIDIMNQKTQRENLRAYQSKSAEERTVVRMEQFGEKRYLAGIQYRIKSIPELDLSIGYQYKIFDLGKDTRGVNSWQENPNHPVISNVVYINHAFYAEGLYELTKKVNIHFGTRYELHTRTKNIGGIFMPKVALMYLPNDRNSIKIIYQTSANTGSADNYEYNRNSYDSNGNPGTEYRYEKPYEKPTQGARAIPPVTEAELHSLKPEKSQSIELISLHSLADKFYVSPSVSYNQINDLFVWNQDVFRTVNAGKYNFINLDLETKFKNKSWVVGLNHTLQKPINTNNNQGFDYETKVFEGYDSVITNQGVMYTPKPIEAVDGKDSMETVTIHPIKDGVSYDGDNFVNLATNITKLYLEYQPVDWLSFHTNCRVFWSLKGRQKLHDESPDFPTLGIEASPVIKWNVSVHLQMAENIDLSIYGYDLLSRDQSIHSMRWQQRASGEQQDLYSSDFSSFAVKLTYRFD